MSLFSRLARVAVPAIAFAVATAAHADTKQIKLGTMSGPDAQIWEVVQKVAKKDGLDVKIIEFNDYIQPNAALDAGELDANSYQHRPFLNAQIKARGYKLYAEGKTMIGPMAS